jgi:hypothetical protein
MAPKSRRNRRNISSNPASAVNINQTTVVNKPVSAPATKSATVESFVTSANFARDVKWTGIVTLIIGVLIVVAFFAVPH